MATTQTSVEVSKPDDISHEYVLGQIEEISTTIVAMTEPELADGENLVEVLELVTQRGVLAKQLSISLAESAPHSYTDRNRLVIVHSQGQRIEANLARRRNDILRQLSTNTRNHAFLNCITGVADPLAL